MKQIDMVESKTLVINGLLETLSFANNADFDQVRRKLDGMLSGLTVLQKEDV